ANQLNVLPAYSETEGNVEVQVRNGLGVSQVFIVPRKIFDPAFFLFDPQGRRYLAAVDAVDGSFLGPPGLFGAALATRPAAPGDLVLLFGTGFGPTLPPFPDGEIITGAFPLAGPVRVLIGGQEAQVAFAGLVGAGLYQFNVSIPQLPAGDHEVVVTVGGVTSPSGGFLTIGP
ncbi:MAG: hypothetical protein GY953_43800, partial [bacterium]|nr:hypothetical protein [bacterium]